MKQPAPINQDKRCSKCRVVKNTSAFARGGGLCGLQNYCKECQGLYRGENRQTDREKAARWRKKNPHYVKGWQRKNAEKVKGYERNYWQKHRQNNPKAILHNRMACSIRFHLKSAKNRRSWLELVDYTIEELERNLKAKIPKGYTWQDFLKGKLHIDHKTPVSVFNFTSPRDIDFKRCWALKNLQLLPIKENLSKNAKLNNHFQPSLRGMSCQSTF